MLEPLVGIIYPFSGNYEPEGWKFCNGKTHSIEQFNSLYSVIGTAYGGNGKDTFAVPNLAKPVPGMKDNYMNYIIAYHGISPSPVSHGIECYIGQVYLFAGNIVPKGWALCNGQLLKIWGSEDNQKLYAILLNRYGGDGKETFALPKLTPPDSGGKEGYMNYIMCINGIFPVHDHR